ncbi:HPr family phosphocarrier protein [bacterium]|nr:MAG: HPr family phosphocarrier protein [bacterium]
MSEGELVRKFEIVNKLGLHARAAAALVKTSHLFSSEIEVIKDDVAVNGKSIMGILMLAAGRGTTITIKVSGPDAQAAMDAVGELIKDGFGEHD